MQVEMPPAETNVWRPTFILRLVAVSFVLGSLGLGAWIMAVAAKEGALLQGVAFVVIAFWLPALGGLRYAMRARIEATPADLVVVTTFGERRFGG
jgi:hypothetical protein